MSWAGAPGGRVARLVDGGPAVVSPPASCIGRSSQRGSRDPDTRGAEVRAGAGPRSRRPAPTRAPGPSSSWRPGGHTAATGGRGTRWSFGSIGQDTGWCAEDGIRGGRGLVRVGSRSRWRAPVRLARRRRARAPSRAWPARSRDSSGRRIRSNLDGSHGRYDAAPTPPSRRCYRNRRPRSRRPT